MLSSCQLDPFHSSANAVAPRPTARHIRPLVQEMAVNEPACGCGMGRYRNEPPVHCSAPGNPLTAERLALPPTAMQFELDWQATAAGVNLCGPGPDGRSIRHWSCCHISRTANGLPGRETS